MDAIEPVTKKPRLGELALDTLSAYSDLSTEAALLRSAGRKKPPWTPTEQAIVAIKHCELGNRWTQIAAFLPMRSENDVKNIWHSTLRCKDTQKRSFLRTYALAVHDNAYDYATRKSMFDMAVRQCGPPPQQATDMIARVQMLLDNPELQAAVHQEHLQQHEQLMAAAAQQQAAAVAAVAQAHAAQLHMQHQPPPPPPHQPHPQHPQQQQASQLQPHEQLLMLLHQQRQQEQRQQEQRQLREQILGGDGGAGLDRERAPLPPQLLHPQDAHQGDARRQLQGMSPGRAALEREELARRLGGGGDSDGDFQEALERKQRSHLHPLPISVPREDDPRAEAAGPQLSASQLLQLQQQLALGKGAGQGLPPPSPSHSVLRLEAAAAATAAGGKAPHAEPGANGMQLGSGGGIKAGLGPDDPAGDGFSDPPEDDVLAQLAAAAAAGNVDISTLVALAAANGIKLQLPAAPPAPLRPPGEPAAPPQPGMDDAVGLLARSLKAEPLQATALQTGPRGGAADDERESPAGLGPRGNAPSDWDEGRGEGPAAAPAAGAPCPVPRPFGALPQHAAGGGALIKAEREEAGGEGAGAGAGAAGAKASGSVDGSADAGATAAASGAPNRTGRDGGASYRLEDADSDELGAVEALALAARMHAQHARAGPSAAAPSAAGPTSAGAGPSSSACGRGSHDGSGLGRAAASAGRAAVEPGAGPAQGRAPAPVGPGPDPKPRNSAFGASAPPPGPHQKPHPQLSEAQGGRLLPAAAPRPTSADALPPRGRVAPQGPLAPSAPPAPQQRPPGAPILDIISLLNVPSQRQQVLSLPVQGLATLLCSPSFGVDCEASVLLLLAEWRGAQAAAGAGVSREHLRVLCGALRLAALGAFHLSGVLPQLLGSSAGGGGGRWFEMRPEELAFLLRFVHASETERAHLAEAASGAYDCSAPWYDTVQRPLSPAASDGYCFQWHIPLQGLRDAVRGGAQPHAAFTIGEDDDPAVATAGGGGGAVAALPCVACRGLEWYVFIDCHQRGGAAAAAAGGAATVAGVFVYCSVPAALRGGAAEAGGVPSPCVGVVPGAGIRLGVYGWRCGRLEEVFVWTFGDETFFVPEAGVGCPTALPLRRRMGSLPGPAAEDPLGAWADYLHEGGLRGSLTFLPP